MSADTLPAGEQTTEERLEALADAGYPPAWNPTAENHPNKITGIVVDYTQAHTARGDLAHVMVLDLLSHPGKRVSVWLLHTALRNEILEKIRPVLGETVFLRYDGMQQPKTEGGDAYHGWTVAVDRNADTMRYPWDLPSGDPRTQAEAMVPFAGEPVAGGPAAAAEASADFPATATDDIPF